MSWRTKLTFADHVDTIVASAARMVGLLIRSMLLDPDGYALIPPRYWLLRS